MADGALVRVEPDAGTEGVTHVVLDRPAALNAISTDLAAQLADVLAELVTDDGLRAVVLSSSNPKAFCVGADLKERNGYTDAQLRAQRVVYRRMAAALLAVPVPVVAAVAGYALGGGCELAMACTLRLAADSARLGQPEISLGLIPGYAGTQRLPRLVGKGRAMEIILTGAPIPAAEAYRIGLVNRVVPAADLLAEAKTLAAQLAASAPIAMRYIINAINKGCEMPFAEACQYEATLFGLVASTDDMREGTKAFLEKRKATFTGA
jgi:enoyl-CoA hydratase